MKQILTFATVLCLLYSCAPKSATIAKTTQSNPYIGKYDDFLEKDEVALKTDYHYMESRKANGKYVLRRFLPENKKLTFYAEYKDANFKIQDGVNKTWYPEGGIAGESVYVNGLREGISKRYDIDSAVVTAEELYLKGKQEGMSRYFNLKGELSSTSEYKEDELDGLTKVYRGTDTLLYTNLFSKGKHVKTDTLVKGLPPFEKIEKMPCLLEFANIENDSIRSLQSNQALLQAVYKNIKYPESDRVNSLEGTVFMKFTIDENGTMQSLKAIRAPSLAMINEVKRVIKQLPPWSPGFQKGKKVRVQYNLPIKFKLE